MILNMTKEEWIAKFPVMGDLCELKETLWMNTNKQPFKDAIVNCAVTLADVRDAEARLARFAPFIQSAFPETEATGGIIESPVVEIPKMKTALENYFGGNSIEGKLMVKLDSHLPISGSIKARGGIYEVLSLAERLAVEAGILTYEDNYAKLDSDEFRNFFGKYSIAVGSTGNLGLSIGIMGAKLGFKTTVHMSADAREWKKAMLRSKGVTVVEYADDYSKAVEEGRRQADADPMCHFVDDENSKTLFMGYSVAAVRLKKQLEEKGVQVDAEHPLFVYLPCGVGGGPGGVAYGLKQMYGDNVHCFFAEPTHSPCMILGMATGYHDKVCVQDFGIDNLTAADGLAVGRASSFVGKTMEPFMSGLYTVTDENMYRMLAMLTDSEGIKLEPSALAGMVGAVRVANIADCKKYIADKGLNMSNATHIAWATGGNMVPADVMDGYYSKGVSLK